MCSSFEFAMIPDKKKGKFNVKDIKCIFLGYREGIKAYRLMCLETTKIIRNKDVMFQENKGRIKNDLEMDLSGN